MTGYVDPTREDFARFREMQREGPIHMLNLLRFREAAGAPESDRKRTVTRPIFLPPGLQFVGNIRLTVRLTDAGGIDHARDQRPITVFAKSHGLEVLTEQEDDP